MKSMIIIGDPVCVYFWAMRKRDEYNEIAISYSEDGVSKLYTHIEYGNDCSPMQAEWLANTVMQEKRTFIITTQNVCMLNYLTDEFAREHLYIALDKNELKPFYDYVHPDDAEMLGPGELYAEFEWNNLA